MRDPAIRAIAELLSMPVIRVLEVVTFYTMFQLEPVGTSALIQVCGTTPCRLRGAGDLMKVCKDKIGPQEPHLGGRQVHGKRLNASAPAPMRRWPRSTTTITRISRLESLGQIIDDFRAGKKPKPGSSRRPPHLRARGRGADPGPIRKLYDGSAGKPIKTLPNAPEKPSGKGQSARRMSPEGEAYQAALPQAGQPGAAGVYAPRRSASWGCWWRRSRRRR